MTLDVEILARVQFALTIMVRYVFPPLSIGLGWLLVIMAGTDLRTNDIEFEKMEPLPCIGSIVARQD